MSSAEYNQLLKFLYFEGYADSYEEAEHLLEDMSDEEFGDLQERSGMSPENRKTLERLMKTKGPNFLTTTRSARKPEPTTVEEPQKRKRTTNLANVRMGEDFEAIVEFLFVEGYADTIENAELIAESISEEWVNEIMEGYVDLNTKTGEMRRRANRTLFVKNDWERANKIDNTRETHSPEKVQAKAEANRRRGEGG